MSILHAPSIPMYRDPAFRPGLAALVEFLVARNYSAHAVGRIFDHVATTGTVAGAEPLDAEDEAGAEAAFVDALPAISFDAEAWDRPDAFIDAESLLAASPRRRIPRDAVIVPPELGGEDDEVLDLADPVDQVHPVLRTAGLALPEPENTYGPTAEDPADVAEFYATRLGA